MKRKKRAITLIEIMIVILLIGLIGGALAFNMRGSMDEGKKFKTKQNISRVEDILTMEYAKGELSMNDIAGKWEELVAASPLVKKGQDAVVDGWNEKLHVRIEGGDFVVSSKHLKE